MNGVPWCAGLPQVSPLIRDTAKPLTLIVPYYENPKFLARQVEGWTEFASDGSTNLRVNLSIIVVDDGSPSQPAEAVLVDRGLLNLRLFRIEQDVRWNWLAARNIGFHHAADGWCLVTDMDHVVPAQTLRSVLYSEHDPSVIYAFRRMDVRADGDMVEIPAHPNSWLMTRQMFWTVGGYDERMSGHYGTDGIWRRRCAATARIHVLEDFLHRHEFDEDSSTTAYKRKQPEDARLKALMATFPKGSKPTHLTFPYHEVSLETVCR